MVSAAFLEVLIRPKRLQICKVEASPLFFNFPKIERAAWNNMIDVPFAVILPSHAGLKLPFQMNLEFTDGTSNEVDGSYALANAFECSANTSAKVD